MLALGHSGWSAKDVGVAVSFGGDGRGVRVGLCKGAMDGVGTPPGPLEQAPRAASAPVEMAAKKVRRRMKKAPRMPGQDLGLVGWGVVGDGDPAVGV